MRFLGFSVTDTAHRQELCSQKRVQFVNMTNSCSELKDANAEFQQLSGRVCVEVKCECCSVSIAVDGPLKARTCMFVRTQTQLRCLRHFTEKDWTQIWRTQKFVDINLCQNCTVTVRSTSLTNRSSQAFAFLHKAISGSIVVKALCYKPEGHGFVIRWGEWLLSIYLILPVTPDPGVYSASYRNEYQKHKNISGE
jgi:hypothetical protein